MEIKISNISVKINGNLIFSNGLSALGTRPTGKENRLVSLFEPLYGL